MVEVGLGAARQVWDLLGSQASHSTSQQVAGTSPLHQQSAGGGSMGLQRMNLG